jgi:hypothetical protein
LDRRPDHVEYTFVYGTNHQTEEEFEIGGSKVNTISNDLGDGTVPTWSAGFKGNKLGVITWPTAGDHIGILSVVGFRDYLYGYFALAPTFRRKALAANGVVLSPSKRTYAPDEPIKLLIIPNKQVTAMNGTLRVEQYKWPSTTFAQVGRSKQISFKGGPANFISAEIPAPQCPGGYRITMAGSH